MVLKDSANSVKSVARKTWLVGLGIVSTLVENVEEVVENAGSYSEKLIERGEQTSKEINDSLDARRQKIRERD